MKHNSPPPADSTPGADVTADELRELLVLQQSLKGQLPQRLERNLHALSLYYPELYERFVNYRPTRKLEFFCTKNGIANVQDMDTQEIFYKVDNPLEECRRQVEEALSVPLKISRFQSEGNAFNQIHYRYTQELDRRLKDYENQGSLKFSTPLELKSAPNALILGGGLGYILPALYEHCEICNTVLIEPDLDLFYASLQTGDWASLFDYLHENRLILKIILSANPEEVMRQLQQHYRRYGRFLASSCVNLTHDVTPALKGIASRLKQSYKLLHSALGLFDDNLFSISHGCAALTKGKCFARKGVQLPLAYRKAPYFIVGNGPSLDHDIPFLQRYQDKVIIMACGSALDTLYHAGIKPDFYGSTERTPHIAETLRALPDDEFKDSLILWCSDVVHPNTAAQFKHTLIYCNPDEAFYKLALVHIPGAEQISPTVSVTPLVGNLGVASAIMLGFEKSYLFGLDCGRHIEGSQMHSSYSTIYSQQGAGVSDKFGNYQVHDLVRANFGGEFLSSYMFRLSASYLKEAANWAGANFGQQFFNCSDGMLLEGFTPQHSEELDLSDLPDLDKQRLHDYIVKEMTVSFSQVEEQVKTMFQPALFAKTVDTVEQVLLHPKMEELRERGQEREHLPGHGQDHGIEQEDRSDQEASTVSSSGSSSSSGSGSSSDSSSGSSSGSETETESSKAVKSGTDPAGEALPRTKTLEEEQSRIGAEFGFRSGSKAGAGSQTETESESGLGSTQEIGLRTGTGADAEQVPGSGTAAKSGTGAEAGAGIEVRINAMTEAEAQAQDRAEIEAGGHRTEAAAASGAEPGISNRGATKSISGTKILVNVNDESVPTTSTAVGGGSGFDHGMWLEGCPKRGTGINSSVFKASTGAQAVAADAAAMATDGRKSLADEQVRISNEPRTANHPCSNLLLELTDEPEFTRLVDPPAERSECVKRMMECCDFIYGLSVVGDGHLGHLLNGTTDSMFMQLLYGLYLGEDEAQALQFYREGSNLYRFFCADAALLYQHLPYYLMGDHTKFLGGKLGGDHPTSPAPQAKEPPALYKNDGYVDPLPRFVKTTTRSADKITEAQAGVSYGPEKMTATDPKDRMKTSYDSNADLKPTSVNPQVALPQKDQKTMIHEAEKIQDMYSYTELQALSAQPLGFLISPAPVVPDEPRIPEPYRNMNFGTYRVMLWGDEHYPEIAHALGLEVLKGNIILQGVIVPPPVEEETEQVGVAAESSTNVQDNAREGRGDTSSSHRDNSTVQTTTEVNSEQANLLDCTNKKACEKVGYEVRSDKCDAQLSNNLNTGEVIQPNSTSLPHFELSLKLLATTDFLVVCTDGDFPKIQSELTKTYRLRRGAIVSWRTLAFAPSFDFKLYFTLRCPPLHTIEHAGRALSQTGKRFILETIFADKIGFKPDFEEPRTLTEKIQWLKLHYKNPLMNKCADCISMRDFVTNILGFEYLTEAIGIYSNVNEIEKIILPEQFTIKISFNTKQLSYKNKKDLDINLLRRELKTYLRPEKSRYYTNYFDESYLGIKPRILIESFSECDRWYWIYCFNGKPKIIQISENPRSECSIGRASYYDMDFNLLSLQHPKQEAVEYIQHKPENLKLMTDISANIANQFQFVTIKFIEINKALKIDRFLFYPASLTPWNSYEIDLKLGTLLQLK